MSALAALWLLLTLGFVLPPATVDFNHETAGAGPVAADQLRATLVVERAGVGVQDGDRLDDGPDDQPLAFAHSAAAGLAGQSEASSLDRSLNLRRVRASPFEARAPPLG